MKRIFCLKIAVFISVAMFGLYSCGEKDIMLPDSEMEKSEHNNNVPNTDNPGDGEEKALVEKTYTYSNPLSFSYPYFNGNRNVMQTELRDPCIIREGDTYYLIYTHYPFTHHTSMDTSKPDMNSSPGIRLYVSNDNMQTWQFADWLVKSSELPDDCPYKHRFWAPEIHKLNGKYYLIFTADNWIDPAYCPNGENGLYAFIGVADQITGPYNNITYLPYGACDTSLFADDNGRTFAIMPKGANQYIREIDLTKLGQGELSWIGAERLVMDRMQQYPANDMPDNIEGPWLIKRDGKFILFMATSYRNVEPNEYWTEVAVSDRLYGPYTVSRKIYPGGHTAVFTGPDNKDWLSVRGEERNAGFTKLNIDPIPFTDDWLLDPFEMTVGVRTITYWEEGGPSDGIY